MFQRNSLKFDILLEYENQCSFFVFDFVLLYYFSNECPAQWASPIRIKIENRKNYHYSCLRGSNMSYEKFMGSRSFI